MKMYRGPLQHAQKGNLTSRSLLDLRNLEGSRGDFIVLETSTCILCKSTQSIGKKASATPNCDWARLFQTGKQNLEVLFISVTHLG